MKKLLFLFILFAFVACGDGNGSGGGGNEPSIPPPAGYTVDFGANGGSAVMPLQVMTDIETEPVATKAGYDFMGWFDNPSLTGTRLIFPYTVTTDITLYARWKPICTPRPRNGSEKAITSASGLANIPQSSTNSYILMDNISLSSYSNWTPIADFKGKLDGNCYVISDLTISDSSGDLALISTSNGAEINNLRLENVNIVRTGGALTDYTGAIIGEAKSTIIMNSYAAGNISILTDNTTLAVGGLVGDAIVALTVENSYSMIDIEVNNGSRVGGIVGYLKSNSVVKNSYNAGVINGGLVTGGIAGMMDQSSMISNSYNIGALSSDNTASGDVGGILGGTNGGNIEYSYSTGAIDSVGWAGGIVGNPFSGGVVSVSCSVAINPSIIAGGLVGRIVPDIANSGNLSDNLALDTMQGSFDPTDRGYGVSKTNAELKTQATYEAIGWKFGNDKDNPWVMLDGGAYPVLYWQ